MMKKKRRKREIKIQNIQQERAEIPFTLYEHAYKHLGNHQGLYFFSDAYGDCLSR